MSNQKNNYIIEENKTNLSISEKISGESDILNQICSQDILLYDTLTKQIELKEEKLYPLHLVFENKQTLK